MAETEFTRSARRTGAQRWFWPAAITTVILSGLVYLPVLHGSPVWDDNVLLDGTGLGGSSSIVDCFTRPFLFAYYRPVTSLSFLIDHHMWGANAVGYHITNIALHMITTAVLLPVLLLAFRRRSIALAGAALFAVQPAQVSTVAWIGGRTDSLCTLFIALLFLSLVAGARCEGYRRRWLLGASVAFYALAALAKEQAVFLLPMIPLGLHILNGSTAPVHALRREMAWCTSICALIAVCLLIGWKVYGNPTALHWDYAFQLSAIGRSIDYYTLLLIAPAPLLMHSMSLGTIAKAGAAGVVVGYLLIAAALAAFVHWMRSEPVVAWFLAGSLLLLMPVSNMFPIGTQTAAPYRAGTAGLGAAAVLGWAVIKLLDSAVLSSRSRCNAICFALPFCVYGLWLSWLTVRDSAVWNNALSASLAVERYDPDSEFGRMETATAYLDIGRVELAVDRLDIAAASIPPADVTDSRHGSSLSSLRRKRLSAWVGELYGRAGSLQLNSGDRPGGMALLNKGALLSPRDPVVNAGLANAALSVHDLNAAEQPIRNVLAVNAGDTNSRAALGRILMTQRRWRDADAEFTICLTQTPHDPNLYMLAALARIRNDDDEGAKVVLQDGLRNGALNTAMVREWLSSVGKSEIVR